MTTNQKKLAITEMAKKMLFGSHVEMLKKIEKAVNSGAIDVDGWDPNSNPAILPKCILGAVLIDEAAQYSAKGTSFEKQVKKETANIGLFI